MTFKNLRSFDSKRKIYSIKKLPNNNNKHYLEASTLRTTTTTTTTTTATITKKLSRSVDIKINLVYYDSKE